MLVCFVLQDGIQRVLLALTLNLSSKMKAADAGRAMAVYCFFVNLLLKDFKTGLCGGTEFILQTILHTLMSTLVRQMSSCLQCHCIDQPCLVISLELYVVIMVVILVYVI